MQSDMIPNCLSLNAAGRQGPASLQALDLLTVENLNRRHSFSELADGLIFHLYTKSFLGFEIHFDSRSSA